MNPRHFEHGLRTTYEGLASFCGHNGFVLMEINRQVWTLQKRGDKGRAKPLKRREAIEAIDKRIRIPAGLQPILGG
jgi:hypothetical protein